MSPFEDYARRATKSLALPEKERRRIRTEIVSHLLDESQRCADQGMPTSEAQAAAIQRFGESGVIHELIDRALAVRQKNLGTLRKLLNLGLVVTLVLGLLANLCAWTFSPDILREALIVWSGIWILFLVYRLTLASGYARMGANLGLLVAYGMLLILGAVRHHDIWHSDIKLIWLVWLFFWLLFLGGFLVEYAWRPFRIWYVERRAARPSSEPRG